MRNLFLDTVRFFELAETPNEHNFSTIEIMVAGEWEHAVYGDVTIDEKLMETIRRNFETYGMAGRIPVDYNHGSEDPSADAERGKAAGWIQKLVMTGKDSLSAVVEWTDEAAEKIRAREYRLISPAYTGDYKHPSSKKRVGPWLHSVALTNRPFLKTRDGGMQPVALSEEAARLFDSDVGEGAENGELEMEFIEMEIGGVIFRVAKDDAEKAGKVFADVAEKAEAAKVEAEQKIEELEAEKADAERKLAEPRGADGEIVQLLKDQNDVLAQRLSDLEAASRSKEAERLLSDALREMKLSKAEAHADGPWARMAATDPGMFADLIANKAPVVDAPRGGEGRSTATSEDQIRAFNEMVRVRTKELKDAGHDVALAELTLLAQSQISDENPELADAAFGV